MADMGFTKDVQTYTTGGMVIARITNADRIRAMSDEELAVTLMCPNEMGMAEIPCDHSDGKNCCQCLPAGLAPAAGGGNAMKNAYAMALQLKKAMERDALIKLTVQRCLDVMTVALNEELGLGPVRLDRVSGRFNALFIEYDGLFADGAVYAESKLARRVEQIMGRAGRNGD